MPISTHRIAAVVLAAGTSSRMGKPKLLMPWKDHTIIEETVDQVLEAGYDSVVVVLGEFWEQVQETLGDRDVKIARNLNYRAGMSGSMKAGVAFVDAQTTAFAIVLGDQPQIEAKTHKLVMAAYRKKKKGICAPVYEGAYGHPVIFSMDYRTKIFGLQGDQGGAGVIASNASDVGTLELKSPEIVGSINTPREYEQYSNGVLATA
jgi:molybdenum cofactor cytidylyltransferase